MTVLTVSCSDKGRYCYEVKQAGTLLGELNAKSESDVRFVCQGQTYRMIRESGWGDFILQGLDGELARAVKPSALTRTFDIKTGAGNYALKAASPFGESFELWQDESLVGSIQAKGFFSTHGEVDFPCAIPLQVQCFLVWLALLMWVRSDDAATTSYIPMG